jgi:hypothetical protein|eukprot:5194934-Prymnesium_polylepis.1
MMRLQMTNAVTNTGDQRSDRVASHSHAQILKRLLAIAASAEYLAVTNTEQDVLEAVFSLPPNVSLPWHRHNGIVSGSPAISSGRENAHVLHRLRTSIRGNGACSNDSLDVSLQAAVDSVLAVLLPSAHTRGQLR